MDKTIKHLQQYLENEIPQMIGFFWKLVFCVIGLYIASKLIKWLCKLTRAFLHRQKIDEAVCDFLISMIKAVLYFLVIATIAMELGVNQASIVAILGTVGVGVGLAIQGGLANLAGGVLILLLKPFKLGDYIAAGGGNGEGVVQRIDMFYTTLLTIDNRKVVIPNAQLTNNTVTNLTAQNRRRLELRVGIAYSADTRRAKAILEDLLEADKSILSEMEEVVFVDELAESSVVVGFRAWVNTEEYWSTRWRLTEEIKLAFDENKIEIPFPQMDVRIRS